VRLALVTIIGSVPSFCLPFSDSQSIIVLLFTKGRPHFEFSQTFLARAMMFSRSVDFLQTDLTTWFPAVPHGSCPNSGAELSPKRASPTWSHLLPDFLPPRACGMTEDRPLLSWGRLDRSLFYQCRKPRFQARDRRCLYHGCRTSTDLLPKAILSTLRIFLRLFPFLFFLGLRYTHRPRTCHRCGGILAHRKFIRGRVCFLDKPVRTPLARRRTVSLLFEADTALGQAPKHVFFVPFS